MVWEFWGFLVIENIYGSLLFWMSDSLVILRISGDFLFWVSDNLLVRMSDILIVLKTSGFFFWQAEILTVPGSLRVVRFSGDLPFWVSNGLIVLRGSGVLSLWGYLAVCHSKCLTLIVLRTSGGLLFWMSDSLIVLSICFLTGWLSEILRISDHLLFWLTGCLKISQKFWEYLKIYWSDCLIIWWSEKIWRWDLIIWKSEIFWYQKISDSDYQIFRPANPQCFSVCQIYVTDIRFFQMIRFSQTFRTLSSCWWLAGLCCWCTWLWLRLHMLQWQAAPMLPLVALEACMVLLPGTG